MQPSVSEAVRGRWLQIDRVASPRIAEDHIFIRARHRPEERSYRDKDQSQKHENRDLNEA
jgi:hypothetical protein